ncbi:MAG: hypothetical protein M5R41_13845 [Bacteroidia bacterium]|nr:hypothetical protein [Bacteroidia bacterium]
MSLPPMSISQSRVIFIIAAAALLLHTQLFIPWLSEAAGIEIIVSWFLCAGLGVFLPLLIAAWVLLEREGPLRPSIWRERLRSKLDSCLLLPVSLTTGPPIGVDGPVI